MADKLYGSTVPRIYTPPLAPLEPRSPETEKRTLGYLFIDFALHVCGIALLPYQEWLAVHALELRPNGKLRFRTILVLIARQNGKSTFSQLLALFAMYVCGVNLVLGTAQDLEVAEEIWQGACDIVEETPELNALKKNIVRVNGKKALELTTKQRYKVKAANRRAPRGLSGDLILLDELREHQNWQAWSAITKTTMARPDAQVWCLSNAGDITSIVLAYLRQIAHKALGDPDGILRLAAAASGPDEFDDLAGMAVEDLEIDEADLGIFEWSAPAGCDLWDRTGWAWANPALGYLIEERSIASAVNTDPEWVVRIEVLCQWPDGATSGPFPSGTWERAANHPKMVDGIEYLAPEDYIVGDVWACVHVSRDRSRTYIAIAGRRADGLAQCEIHAARPGVDWAREWLTHPARRSRIKAVTGQARGAQASPLIEEWANDPTFPIPVVGWGGPDLAAAHGQVFDLVKFGRVRHNNQPALNLPATSAQTRDLGEGWVIDARASTGDTAALSAFIGALWLLMRPAPTVHMPAGSRAVQETEPGRPTNGAGRSTTADLASVHF